MPVHEHKAKELLYQYCLDRKVIHQGKRLTSIPVSLEVRVALGDR